MPTQAYRNWVSSGQPYHTAQPIVDMCEMFAANGYEAYGGVPDQRHLWADPPEDHTPYSATGWPEVSPYPYGHALDLMPKEEGDGKSLAFIARRIIADKRAGKMPWLKYMNWTDENGHVWHTKWQPNEVTESSSDSGHIHLSIRSDFTFSTAAKGWTAFPAAAIDPEEEETSMFIAKDSAGQYYLCDGMVSRPISSADANQIAYCSSSGYGIMYDLRHGDPAKNPTTGTNREWEDIPGGQPWVKDKRHVRLQWGPNYCGPVGVPVGLSDTDIDEIAQKTAAQIDVPSGATKGEVADLLNHTKLGLMVEGS